MASLIEKYLGGERKQPGMIDIAKEQADKERRVEDYLYSTGMPKWLAKISLQEKIRIIWESEENGLQPA